MKKYDLITVGGGLSGVAAAVSAARAGLKVLLIEKSGALGGAITNNLIYPFMIFWRTTREGKREYLNTGIFTEMRERQFNYEAPLSDGQFRPEVMKIVLDDMAQEAGVELLFHTTVFEVTTEKDRLTAVKALAKSEVMEFEASYFIDATGDGELFYKAGCEYQLGRSSDGLCQPMTTCFRMSGVDVEAFKADRSRLQALYEQKQQTGEILNPRENILVFYGIGKDILHFNTTRVIKHNPVDAFDVSKAEVIARKQIFELVKFFKENSKAFENSTVISIANEIGVRESRKLVGRHVLTTDELKNCVEFDDTIAIGNYEIDIHNPAGTGTELYYFKPDEYYKIPYRSLLPKEYTNLVVVGRSISASHEAQAAIRILPICACIGQAGGTAVAVAAEAGVGVTEIDVKKLQSTLIKNGAKLSL